LFYKEKIKKIKSLLKKSKIIDKNILDLHEILKEIELELNAEEDKWFCILCFENLGVDMPDGYGCGDCGCFYCEDCAKENKIVNFSNGKIVPEKCLGCFIEQSCSKYK
jgi:hypothetical protein